MKNLKKMMMAQVLFGSVFQAQAAEHIMMPMPMLGLLNLGGFEILLILLMLMAFIALPVVGVFVILYFVTQRNRSAGQPPVVNPTSTSPQVPVVVPLSRTGELRWGIIFIAAGVGIMGSFAMIFGPNLWAIGLIPTCIGVGCVIAGLIRAKS